MSRPKPTVLLSSRTSEGKTVQILAADAIYAIFYDGKPINVKHINVRFDITGPKYKKSSFSNSGHAFNLAQKLNSMFKTDKFTVHKLVIGDVVIEGVDDE